MTLCDVCLEPTADSALLTCVESEHCADCHDSCLYCQDAAADEYRAGVAEDIRLNGAV